MNKSFFELLGIINREDSFTDLITTGINNDPIFQKSFFEKVLNISPSHGWKAISRISVFIYSDNKKRKDCPDIVLTNSNIRKCVIIENKISSGEGWAQTERYASNEFSVALKSKFQFPIEDIKYFYLTLDGTKPLSSIFIPISYDLLRNCENGNDCESKIQLLLSDLKEILTVYYNHSGPNDADIVLDYLKTNDGLIGYRRNFQLFANAIFGSLNSYTYDVGETSNRGSGFIPLCLVYKNHWGSLAFPSETNGYNCFDIHYELQWDTRADWEKLSFYIHYHTNPYMTQKELLVKKVPKEFLIAFENRRNMLRSYLSSANIDNWVLSLTTLRIGYIAFPKEATFKEIKSTIVNSLEKTTVVIDKFLEESANQAYTI